MLAAGSTLACAWGAGASDRVAEIAALHGAAMGGAERVAALKALRATGEGEAGGKRVRFVLLAARPDRVRLETEAEGRRLVQGTDGAEPPWELDTGASPPRGGTMGAAAARLFAADAEFDDPLVAGRGRAYSIDEAGFVDEGGARWPRVLVTCPRSEPFHLVLDPTTYLIVRRIELRGSALGRKTEVVMRYGDFRLVAGVVLPHVVEVTADGRLVQRTRIDRIEANPAHDPAVFRRPAIAEKL